MAVIPAMGRWEMGSMGENPGTKYPFLYTDGSPQDVHDKLCRQALDFATVADKIVDIDAELLPLENQIKDRELELFLTYRKRKDEAEKGDPEYKWVNETVDALIREDIKLKQWRRRATELRVLRARYEVPLEALKIRERSLSMIAANNRAEGAMR
jgi:hypothetical protein